MQALLTWLDGKKALIVSILSLINSYLVAVNLYDAALGTLVQSILSLLAGGAVVATKDMLGSNKLGIRK